VRDGRAGKSGRVADAMGQVHLVRRCVCATWRLRARYESRPGVNPAAPSAQSRGRPGCLVGEPNPAFGWLPRRLDKIVAFEPPAPLCRRRSGSAAHCLTPLAPLAAGQYFVAGTAVAPRPLEAVGRSNGPAAPGWRCSGRAGGAVRLGVATCPVAAIFDRTEAMVFVV
jgi:hypothetical protein